MINNNHQSRFDKRLENLPNNVWKKIAEIDQLKGQWIGGVNLHPQILGHLKKSVLITSSGASTRIEGASLSDEDVSKLMSGLLLQKFTDRDKQEVKGYYELLKNIFDSWRYIKLSETTVQSFHKELLKYTEKDISHYGKYKKLENKVAALDEEGKMVGIIFETTPPYLVKKEMEDLILWFNYSSKNATYHPLLIIASFLVEFLKIHPFQDGNGRLSRILTNLLLLQNGYLYIPYISHEKIIEDNKQTYYLSLRNSQKTFKTTKDTILPWLDFFLGVVLKQARLAIELLDKENIENILSTKQRLVWELLKSGGEFSPLEISQKTKIARPTINQIVNKLILLKRIEKIGLGRATKYRVLIKEKEFTP